MTLARPIRLLGGCPAVETTPRVRHGIFWGDRACAGSFVGETVAHDLTVVRHAARIVDAITGCEAVPGYKWRRRLRGKGFTSLRPLASIFSSAPLTLLLFSTFFFFSDEPISLQPRGKHWHGDHAPPPINASAAKDSPAALYLEMAGGNEGGGEWRASHIAADDIARLRERGFLATEELVGTRLVEPGEVLVFTDHLDCGLALPASSFFKEFLQFFRLQSHHLGDNSIASLSYYAAICEGYHGIWPNL